MKALRTKTPGALNDPRTWNQYLRPWFDVERFQERINNRVGLQKDGRPIVRLSWAQDISYHFFNEPTPRYWLKRQKTHLGPVYWTMARWVFERRLEPEQYMDAWNENRYSLRDPTEGSPRCGDCGWGEEPKLINGKLYCASCMSTNITGGAVIDKGPPPDEYYIFMLECAVHEQGRGAEGWPWCCTQAFYGETRWGGPHSRCWGSYRQPNDFDLEVLSQSTRAMEAAKFRDPYRALSQSELFEAELIANKQVERADEQLRKLEEEITRDNINRVIRQPTIVDFGANRQRSPLEAELAARAVSRIMEARTRQIT